MKPGQQTPDEPEKKEKLETSPEETQSEKDDKAYKALSPEELEEQRQQFVDAQFGGGKPKKDKKEDKSEPDDKAKKPEAKETEGKESETDAKDKKPPESTDKKQEAKPPRAKPAKQTSTEQTDAIIHGIKEAVQPLVDKVAGKDTPPQPDNDLTPKDKNRLEVLRHLEKTDERYRGLSAKTVEFWRREKEYQDNWKKTNPDTKFDHQSEEHDDFYKKHEPPVDEDDLDRAKEDMIVERATAASNKRIDEHTRKLNLEREFEKEKPVIEKLARESIFDFLPIASPELAKHMEVEKDGEKGLVMNQEVLEKMREDDPESVDILMTVNDQLRLTLTELHTLSKFPEHYPIRPDYNVRTEAGDRIYPHMEIIHLTKDLEAELSQLPEEETAKGNRKFITHDELMAKRKALGNVSLAELEKAKAETEKRFWWIKADDLEKAVVDYYASKAERLIGKFKARDERRAKSSATEATHKGKEKEGEEHEITRRTKPPSTSSASDKVDTTKKNTSPGGISEESFHESMGW